MSRYPKNLKKRGKIWWYRFTHKGQPFEGSLETDNLATARERLATKREELIATAWGKKPKRTFNEASVRFGKEHFKVLKPNAAKRYYVSISNLLKKFDGMKLEDITSAGLSEFEQMRKSDGVSQSTIRRDLACLSVIFSSAEEWEWTTSNPVKPFLRGRKKKKGLVEGDARTRYLSHEEEAELIEHAPQKVRRAIIFAIDTGLRKDEMNSLMWSDVDFRKRELQVRAAHTKSSKPRSVPLLERAYVLLQEMRKADLKTLYVFSVDGGSRYSGNSHYQYDMLQKARRRANKIRAGKDMDPMPSVQWHDLRRTCGCRLLQDREFSMEAVSRWLGHSSVKVTESRYAFLQVEQLHAAVAKSENNVVKLRQ